MYRAAACNMVLEWQSEGSGAHRAHQQALSLTMAITWLVNGLHSAPDVGQASRDLMDNILPHINRRGADPNELAYGAALDSDDDDDMSDVGDEVDANDDDEGSDGDNEDSDEDEDEGRPRARTSRVRRRRLRATLPAYPHGLVFLRDIRVGVKHPVPRFYENKQFVTDKTFKYFFGCAQPDVLHKILNASVGSSSNSRRVRNKTRRTITITEMEDEPPANAPAPFVIGGEIPAPDRDEGSDLEDEDNNLTLHCLQGRTDAAILLLWRQCLKDIANKVSNEKQSHLDSYTRLSESDLGGVNEETFKNHNLAAFFIDCRIMEAKPEDWERTFRHLFPPRGFSCSGKLQNYRQCSYWTMWISLCQNSNVTDAVLARIRAKLWERFRTLYWMPNTQSERIWYTKFDKRFNKISGFPNEKAAPRVLINGKKTEALWDVDSL